MPRMFGRLRTVAVCLQNVWRKLVGVEPTRDTKCRTTGFEDQAWHRLRLASSRDSNIGAPRFFAPWGAFCLTVESECQAASSDGLLSKHLDRNTRETQHGKTFR